MKPLQQVPVGSTCGDCRWFVSLPRDPDVCHYYPPKIKVKWVYNEDDGLRKGDYQTYRPIVDCSEKACSKWKPCLDGQFD